MLESDNNNMLTADRKKDGMEKLKALIKDFKIIKKFYIDDPHLEKYLYGANFDADSAFNKIKNHYELLSEYPDWFRVEGPLQKKPIIDKDIRMFIPQRDKEGRLIYIMKMGKIDPSTMGMFDIVAVDDIWIESTLASNPRITQNGLCVILDVANYPWKVLKWATPENIKLTIRKILNLPFKDLRVHIVNKSIVMQVAIKITWPLLPDSLRETIKFHFDDWNGLYKHVDKNVLPPEYGGSYDIVYNKLYDKLYEKDEEIVRVLKLYRDVSLN